MFEANTKPVGIDEVWGNCFSCEIVGGSRGCKYPAKAVVESGSEPSVGGSSVPANLPCSSPKMRLVSDQRLPSIADKTQAPSLLLFQHRHVLKLPTFSPVKCHCELKSETGLLPFSAAQRKSQRGFRTSCQRGDPWGRGFQAVLYM